ncbi:hypothetical protein [Hyphomonas sp.]|jgi:uncharacterized protein YeeX (DUF496 family)|uniref:hypothetical protein n=1 Tax=Hyphomonas sp. TaxID=87 RepID=UPI0037C0397E
MIAEAATSAHVVEKLLNIGGTAGILYVAIYFLVRTLKDQYESRISALEVRSDHCEQDRRSMHQEIRLIQQERIGALERVLRHREDEDP